MQRFFFCSTKKIKHFGPQGEEWLQFLVTTEYRSCTATFLWAAHCLETGCYWFFSVKNSTFTPSVHFTVQQRTSAGQVGHLEFVDVRLQNVNNKWSFQMIRANKAGEEQITKGGAPCWDGPDAVCVLYCTRVTVSVKQPGGPEGWSSCVRRQSEDLWRASSACSCLSALQPLTGLTRATAISIQAFSRPFLLSRVFCFPSAKASDRRDCNCRISSRLSDCNFNSLTSLQWEYLKQCVAVSVGSCRT